MTEAEWNECADPYLMLWTLKGKDSDRKTRLFGVACCRRVWHCFKDSRSRKAVETAEQYADRKVREAQREEAREGARAVLLKEDRETDPAWALRGELVKLLVSDRVSTGLLCSLFNEAAQKINVTGEPNEAKPQSALLRDIFGPLPFRPITSVPSWLTATATQLADAIYQERTFDRMPILADALEDAGCTDPDILAHCRGPGPHVRGCWVVDLLLAKS